MNVLMTVSDSYMPYCGISIESMLDNNEDIDINVYVICPDLSTENRERMGKIFSSVGNAKLKFLELTPKMASKINEVALHLRKVHNSIFLLRLLAEQILPQDINKILYIDADTVITDSLKELDLYEFNDNIGVAVVKDAIRDDDYTRLNIDRNRHTYFNSGVMLINLEYWRRHNVGERCLETLLNEELASFMPDQDALNIILEGHAEYLHPRYNCMTLFSMNYKNLRYRVQKDELHRVENAVNNPAIIHYVFVNKPWFKGCVPKRELWDNYRMKSVYKDTPVRWRNGIKSEFFNFLYC